MMVNLVLCSAAAWDANGSTGPGGLKVNLGTMSQPILPQGYGLRCPILLFLATHILY